jgi:hypothetical protein
MAEQQTMEELLSDRLAALIKPREAATVREVFRILGDDDIARAWIIGMNSFLDDESPLVCIIRGESEKVLRAARAQDEGTVSA